MSSSLVPSQPVPASARPVPRPGPARPGAVAQAKPARSRGWDALLVCLAAYLFTAVGRIHQLFSPLGHLKPVLLACALAILFYLGDRSSSRRLAPVLRIRTTRWALALVFWAGVSVITALRPGEAAMSFGNELVKTVAIYVLIVAAARDWKDVERLALVYFVAVAIYAVVVLVRFEVTTDKWRLGSLYYYDSNDFATLIVTALPIGLYLTVVQKRWLWRAMTMGGMGCLLIAFVWCGSRGGLLALLVMSGFLVIRYKAIHAAWRVGATAVMLLLIVATAGDKYWAKMDSLLHPHADYNVSDPYGRIQVWQRGLGYMLQFPFTGVGFGNFSVAEGTLFQVAADRESKGKGAKWGVAHNSFIQAGAELGVPGLVFFLGILLSAIIALRSVRAIPGGPRGPPQLAQSLTAALLGFMVGSFFLTLTYSDMVFSLAGLAAALWKTTRLARSRFPGKQLPRLARW